MHPAHLIVKAEEAGPEAGASVGDGSPQASVLTFPMRNWTNFLKSCLRRGSPRRGGEGSQTLLSFRESQSNRASSDPGRFQWYMWSLSGQVALSAERESLLRTLVPLGSVMGAPVSIDLCWGTLYK